MDNDIEKNLNLMVEDLYTTLKTLAETLRDPSKSPNDIAKGVDGIRFTLCKHWPLCSEAHSKEFPKEYSS